MASIQGTCVHYRGPTPDGGVATPCRPLLVTRDLGAGQVLGQIIYDFADNPAGLPMLTSSGLQVGYSPQLGVLHDASGVAVGSWHSAAECTF